MPEFLYIATNPSMPGLVKVGWTSRPPSERMVELRGTGVPTSFELAFVVKVPTGIAAERRAHRVLSSFRISREREFFRCEVRAAIGKIMPALKCYEIDWTHTPRDPVVEELDREIANSQHELREHRAQERQRLQETARVEMRETAEMLKRETQGHRSRLETAHQEQLHWIERQKALGSRPTKPAYPFLGYAYRFPTGLISWVLFLVAVTSKLIPLGVFCVFYFLLGWYFHSRFRRESAKFESAIAPWREPDSQLRYLSEEIRSLDDRIAHNEKRLVQLA